MKSLYSVATAMVCKRLVYDGTFSQLFSAWVQGAADPTSGTVSLHEVIKGLGLLLTAGWTPLRTSKSGDTLHLGTALIWINTSHHR